MVLFGSFALPHVLNIQTTKARLTTERDLPYGSVAYRSDDRDLGQTLLVTGEIRDTDIDAVIAAIEQIRTLNDGVARPFDLEDAAAPVLDAKLVDPSFNFTSGNWFSGKYRVSYQVTFLEAA